MILTLSLYLFFLFSFRAQAEYRVYQYYVTSLYKSSLGLSPVTTYLETSTLDPTSYLFYHGGEESIRVDLLRSWICKGYTGERTPPCQSPLGVYLRPTKE